MPALLRVVVTMTVAVLTMGCLGRAPNRSSPGPVADGGAGSTVVLAAELVKVGQGKTLREALERARPWFLSGRGAVPVVSVDGSPASDLSLLNMIPVAEVAEVRLQRGPYGLRKSLLRENGDVVVGDVILVTTRVR